MDAFSTVIYCTGIAPNNACETLIYHLYIYIYTFSKTLGHHNGECMEHNSFYSAHSAQSQSVRPSSAFCDAGSIRGVAATIGQSGSAQLWSVRVSSSPQLSINHSIVPPHTCPVWLHSEDDHFTHSSSSATSVQSQPVRSSSSFCDAASTRHVQCPR